MRVLTLELTTGDEWLFHVKSTQCKTLCRFSDHKDDDDDNNTINNDDDDGNDNNCSTKSAIEYTGKIYTCMGEFDIYLWS